MRIPFTGVRTSRGPLTTLARRSSKSISPHATPPLICFFSFSRPSPNPKACPRFSPPRARHWQVSQDPNHRYEQTNKPYEPASVATNAALPNSSSSLAPYTYRSHGPPVRSRRFDRRRPGVMKIVRHEVISLPRKHRAKPAALLPNPRPCLAPTNCATHSQEFLQYVAIVYEPGSRLIAKGLGTNERTNERTTVRVPRWKSRRFVSHLLIPLLTFYRGSLFQEQEQRRDAGEAVILNLS